MRQNAIMNSRVLGVALLCCLFAPTANAELRCGHLISAERSFLAGNRALASRPVETWANTDLLANDLDIEAIHATETIVGSNTMTLRSTVAGLSEFTFRLADSFAISSVQLDGRTIGFTRMDPIHVRANFDRTYGAGQSFTLRIAYGGPATAGAGFGSIEFTTQNSQPLIFTLSEPFYSYTWWPSKDDNEDKAINRIAVTVPSTMKVAANGVLLGTDVVAGGKLKWRYSCTYPMADYLLMFSATNYNEWTQTYSFAGGSMPVRFMIFPSSDTPSNRTAWGNSLAMLGVFESKFGPYPFRNDQYGIYQFAFGGGMEHQTFTGQSGFGESLTSHELGHQWWGDMVTCGTWHDIWLNEGFATYCEALWLQYKAGSTGWPALKTAMASRKPSSFNGSVYRYDISSTATIFSSNFAYRKAAWVLHMYRRVVGEAIFWTTLTNYKSMNQYSSAVTADFVAAAELTSGQDLDWFFDPWVMQNGAVRYSLGSQLATIDGKNYLLLKVSQIQGNGYPIYRMPVDLRFTDGAGQQDRTIWNHAATQWYLVPVVGTPGAVTLDPDGWILTTGTTTAVSYTPGPPKILAVSPRPGAARDNYLGRIRVTFHTNVAVSPSDFELRTDAGVPVPFIVSYQPSSRTATITPTADLDMAGLELTVRDSITAVDSGMALDGESPGYAWPSGDGVPGGPGIFRFSY